MNRHLLAALAKPNLGLIDRLGINATAAYSLRKLRKFYSGKCCNIRRSSDNATTDIGFNITGLFDTVGFSAFIGAGSGFVTKWYDQSGNGNDASQATAANQPQLALNATPSGKPALVASGSQYLIVPALTIAQPISIIASVSRTGNTAAVTDMFYNGNSPVTLQFSASANTVRFTANAIANPLISATAADSVFHTLAAIADDGGSASALFVNGTKTTGTVGTGTLVGTSGIFASSAGGNPMTGDLTTLLLFPSLVTDTQVTTITNSERAYGGW